MFETEQEYKDEIALVSTAITNILKTSQKYEVGSGASKRVFEAVSINDLIKYRSSLTNELKTFNGASGMQVGF